MDFPLGGFKFNVDIITNIPIIIESNKMFKFMKTNQNGINVPNLLEYSAHLTLFVYFYSLEAIVHEKRRKTAQNARRERCHASVRASFVSKIFRNE